MKESKHQHRTRIIETSKTATPAQEEEKEHWPVGPLPDAPLNQDIEEESLDKEDKIKPEEPPKKSDTGSDQWSVSWP